MTPFSIPVLTLLFLAPMAPPAAPQTADDCAVSAPMGPGQPEPARDAIVTVGLTERVDIAHAPRPTNDSERLVFAQLYETLVRVDCTGRVVSGLAAAWRLEVDQRTWIVTLRADARFSDGARVTSADVRTSWTRPGENALRPEVARLVESIAETDDRTLAIRLPRAGGDMPFPLAHPDLAIAKPVSGSPWPLGTRAGLAAGGRAPAITVTRDAVERLRFLVAPGDPRDLLDRGVDLLLTRNRAALDYAGALPSLQSTPLAWERTHVLLSPGRVRGGPALSDDQREALARDAVRGEARGARGPFWWQGLAGCGVTPVAAPTGRSVFTPRILYDADDPVARDLAERFVGLVRAGTPGAAPVLDVLLPDRPRRTYQRATGLTGAALAEARRLTTDAGQVLAIDSHPIDPCAELQRLADAVPWFDPETIVPLVETRRYAVVRRGRIRITTESNGGLLIDTTEPARGDAAR